MREHIKDYKKKLEKAICDYMQNAVTERSADAVRTMIKCWKKVNELEHMMCWGYDFTSEDAKKWNEKMVNDDGTMGGHWTIDQTTAVAESIGVKFEHISEYCWNAAMNMMYSDYCDVAMKYGVSTPEFFADMAKAFLFDKDAEGPKAKMAAYYHGIVDHEE